MSFVTVADEWLVGEVLCALVASGPASIGSTSTEGSPSAESVDFVDVISAVLRLLTKLVVLSSKNAAASTAPAGAHADCIMLHSLGNKPRMLSAKAS